MREWEPVDWIVIAFAAVLSAVAIMVVGSLIYSEKRLEESEADRIMSFLLALCNIVSLYIGLKMGHDQKRGENRDLPRS